MTKLNGKVAVVTGASKGIGAEVARRLASDGFAVVVNHSNSESDAEDVVDAINKRGGQAIAVKANVGDPAAVTELFSRSVKAFGGIDVLVNNAGIMKLAPLAEVADESFDAQVSVNFAGVFYCMREGARKLRDDGRIISFSSSVIGTYASTYGVYAATKAAVEAMTHVLAKELGPRGITVNAVAPGPVATKLFLDGKSQSLLDTIVKDIPLGRLGQPVDIAGVVSFLAGPDAGWVNGQVLRTNGGRN